MIATNKWITITDEKKDKKIKIKWCKMMWNVKWQKRPWITTRYVVIV